MAGFMTTGMLGKKHSEETKRKISESKKKLWAEFKAFKEAKLALKSDPSSVYSSEEDNKSPTPE